MNREQFNMNGVFGEKLKPIDREKTCPLLLRLFYNSNQHNNLADFSKASTPSNELQIYTWLDASLRELSGLVREVHGEARLKGTLFHFAIVHPHPRSTSFKLRDIGSTCSGKRGADDTATLSSCGFRIGDFIDIAITPPPRRDDRW